MRNKLITIGFIFLLMFQTSCGQSKTKNPKTMSDHPFTNELIHESSPYLLQHAHNAVNWYPWGDKALQKAKDENKMIIISIGYAACHWCHVMERESYEDTGVARIMNEHFISIKVDREERPDLDQVYMNAAQLITGSGGWPLNALAMPDGKPFYAGTYFPKTEWIKMLNYFIDLYQKNPSALKDQSEKVTKGIHEIENVPLNNATASFSLKNLDAAFGNIKPSIDFNKGGENRAPKFPMPAVWDYLLYYNYLSDNKEALKAVTTTLNNMANGGIYDHVGGGFARYSTDADWHVPHFEKMLYDNAQLVGLFSHAYQVTKNPIYKKTVEETLQFVEREMTSDEGGFYSSLDADSEGEEGKFYVWTYEEVVKALGDKAAVFNAYYNVQPGGNWEHGKNILFRKKDAEKEVTSKFNITAEQLNQLLEQSKITLLKERSKRVRPGLDDKILTAWNALMLKGYVQAYRAFGEEKYLQAAIKNAQFLINKAISKNDEITRNYKNGKASIPAFLDDYAFTIAAFIELYQATFNEDWLLKARELAGYTQTHFFDKSSGMFFYTHNEHSNLIARKMEVGDNVIPSSNSEMAKNLYYLGQFFGDESLGNVARQMLLNVQKNVEDHLYYYPNWAMLQAAFAGGVYDVAIVGNNAMDKRKELDQHYLPNTLLLGGKTEGTLELLENKWVDGKTTIYVCMQKVCKLPVQEVKDALPQIKPKPNK